MPLQVQADRSKTEELSHEREVLEELVRSEGWGIYTTRLMGEWRDRGYFSRMSSAMADSDKDMPKIIHKTAIEVQKALLWPIDRIKYLGGKTE